MKPKNVPCGLSVVETHLHGVIAFPPLSCSWVLKSAVNGIALKLCPRPILPKSKHASVVKKLFRNWGQPVKFLKSAASYDVSHLPQLADHFGVKSGWFKESGISDNPRLSSQAISESLGSMRLRSVSRRTLSANQSLPLESFDIHLVILVVRNRMRVQHLPCRGGRPRRSTRASSQPLLSGAYSYRS